MTTIEPSHPARFSVGDRVVARWNGRRGIVIHEYDEKFHRGGVQQVIGVRWGDGSGTVMRAAHFAFEAGGADA